MQSTEQLPTIAAVEPDEERRRHRVWVALLVVLVALFAVAVAVLAVMVATSGSRTDPPTTATTVTSLPVAPEDHAPVTGEVPSRTGGGRAPAPSGEDAPDPAAEDDVAPEDAAEPGDEEPEVEEEDEEGDDPAEGPVDWGPAA